MREMRVEWFEPYRQVLDASRGPEWTQWFTGGRLNIAHNCLDRWAEIRPRRLPLGERERRRPAQSRSRELRDRGQPRGQRPARPGPRGRRPRGAVPAHGPGDPRHPLRLLQGGADRGADLRGLRRRAPSPRAWRIPARACCSPRTTWSGAASALPLAGEDAAHRRRTPSCCARLRADFLARPARRIADRSRSIPKRAPSSSTLPAPRASPKARSTPMPAAWRKWARRSGWASTTATTTASSGSPTSAG